MMHRPESADTLPAGLYELLLTERVAELVEGLGARGRTGAIAEPEVPEVLAQHLATVLGRVLRAPGLAHDLGRQVALCNRVLALIDEAVPDVGTASEDSVARAEQLLTVLPDVLVGLGEVREPPRPLTPLSRDALLVHAPHEPVLASELRRELASADRVDLLCAFVVWSGVRVLLDELRAARERGVPLRVITTTYTGTTEQRALDELTRLGAEVRVSYDTRATRLHAKAWLFERDSGFSTAYIGSSNLTHSALHEGLEWNVRVAEASSPGLLERFRAAFETYWADLHLEAYEPERFQIEVGRQRSSNATQLVPFDIRPYPFQAEMLRRLEVERVRHGRWRNLLVAATGTGKTVVSAFDYDRLARDWGRTRLLFVAHRQEILRQSLTVFRNVLKDGSFGELLVAGERPRVGEHVFASVQSLSNLDLTAVATNYYDVVIVDEFHHAWAPTYKRLLDQLRPRVLLGMTATPERMNPLEDVTRWFDGRIAVELRLWDALEQGLLCPFQYFGVSDDVDLSGIEWRRGGYNAGALSRLYTGHDVRLAKVLEAVRRYVAEPAAMRALGFCVSVEHARYMAERFTAAGISALAIDAKTPDSERAAALRRLRAREVNVVFSVDLFNEGLDVPDVDTVLLLRPTESSTVFLQQLGRGLRFAPGKAGLTVLDFIGQQHRQFRFEPRFAALTGQARAELVRSIEQGFPYLPPGCAIQLDRVAREVVLRNVRAAVDRRTLVLADELRRLGPVDLRTFLQQSERELDDIYRSAVGGWSRLQRLAGFDVATGPDQDRLQRAVGRMLHVDDEERVAYYTKVLAGATPPDLESLDQRAHRLLTMLHFDLWDRGTGFMSLDYSLRRLWEHPSIRGELLQLLEVLGEGSKSLGLAADLEAEIPLWVHQRYTWNEVLAALGTATVERPPSSREGVFHAPDGRLDAFFVTLQKTPGRFSPSTMYRDYAISPERFHWESQSTTSSRSPTGQRYIHHAARGHRIVLFARETPEVAGGGTRPYLFLGQATYVEHRGDRPMAITWRLHRPLPPWFYQEARAVA